MTVPAEILERYAAGEREIRVSARVYADYCDGLMVGYRRVPNEQAAGDEKWVAYKDARVIAVREYAMNTTGMQQCPKCGDYYGVGDFPFCTPTSGHGRGVTLVSGDECDYVDHNLGPEPIRITSWSQRRQLMAERGLVDYQYDVEVPEGMAENKQRPSRWGAYRRVDAEHLAWLAAKLSTGKAEKTPDEPAMQIRTWTSTGPLDEMRK